MSQLQLEHPSTALAYIFSPSLLVSLCIVSLPSFSLTQPFPVTCFLLTSCNPPTCYSFSLFFLQLPVSCSYAPIAPVSSVVFLLPQPHLIPLCHFSISSPSSSVSWSASMSCQPYTLWHTYTHSYLSVCLTYLHHYALTFSCYSPPADSVSWSV